MVIRVQNAIRLWHVMGVDATDACRFVPGFPLLPPARSRQNASRTNRCAYLQVGFPDSGFYVDVAIFTPLKQFVVDVSKGPAPRLVPVLPPAEASRHTRRVLPPADTRGLCWCRQRPADTRGPAPGGGEGLRSGDRGRHSTRLYAGSVRCSGQRWCQQLVLR